MTFQQWQRRVLMPNNQPIGSWRFIEQSSSKWASFGTENLTVTVEQPWIRRQRGDARISERMTRTRSATGVGAFYLYQPSECLFRSAEHSEVVPSPVDPVQSVSDLRTCRARKRVPQIGWKHDYSSARTDVTMLLGLIFLLLVGAGAWSLDAWLAE